MFYKRSLALIFSITICSFIYSSVKVYNKSGKDIMLTYEYESLGKAYQQPISVEAHGESGSMKDGFFDKKNWYKLYDFTYKTDPEKRHKPIKVITDGTILNKTITVDYIEDKNEYIVNVKSGL